MQGLLFENHDFSMFSSLNRNQASEIYHPYVYLKRLKFKPLEELGSTKFRPKENEFVIGRFIGCALYLMMRKVRLKHVSFGLQGRSSKLFKIPRFSLPLGDTVSDFLRFFLSDWQSTEFLCRSFLHYNLQYNILANKKRVKFFTTILMLQNEDVYIKTI